jgi:putative membrane protein
MHIEGGPIDFLILGLVIGVLNAFLRPVLQFITLRLIFVTGGLILILINAILLWKLKLLLPEKLAFDNIITIFLAAFLVGFFVLVLESLFGVTPLIINPTLIEADRRPE